MINPVPPKTPNENNISQISNENDFSIEQYTPEDNYIQSESEDFQTDNYSVDDDKKANKICIASLICMYGSSIIVSIISWIFSAVSDIRSFGDISNTFVAIIGIISAIAPIIGLILMIYVRVKFPQNRFGKVIMIIYIVQLVVSLIAIIVLVLACISCAGELRNCGMLFNVRYIC